MNFNILLQDSLIDSYMVANAHWPSSGGALLNPERLKEVQKMLQLTFNERSLNRLWEQREMRNRADEFVV